MKYTRASGQGADSVNDGFSDNENLSMHFESIAGKNDWQYKFDFSAVTRDEGEARENEFENIFATAIKQNFTAQAGQMTVNLSNITFNKNIEGLRAEYSIENVKMQIAAGRIEKGKDNEMLERWGHGERIEKKYLDNKIIFGLNHSYIWEKEGIANKAGLSKIKLYLWTRFLRLLKNSMEILNTHIRAIGRIIISPIRIRRIIFYQRRLTQHLENYPIQFL